MTDRTPIHYEDVCRYVGHLFLETRHELERLRAALTRAEQERDDALRLLNRDPER